MVFTNNFETKGFHHSTLAEKKLQYWDKVRKTRGSIRSRQSAYLPSEVSLRGEPKACLSDVDSITINGEDYDCSNVDFESLVGISELIITRPAFSDTEDSLSDIWGWEAPSGEQIVIVCMNNGVRFLDITNSTQPINLGYMASDRFESPWCDVKVYKDVAYIVKDSGSAAGSGMQIFNLSSLIDDNVYSNSPQEFNASNTYSEHSFSHNLVVNTESGFLYSVGSNTCDGGLHIIDLNVDPINPSFVVCADMDGYVHDAQCVMYDGPDTRYNGNEICFGYNEDSLTIYDVSNKSSIAVLGKTTYPNVGYTHQGWLTPDMKYILLDDETDELDNLGDLASFDATRLFIMDVQDLENPEFYYDFYHPIRSIDHNLYNWGAMYERGWLESSDPVRELPSDIYVYCNNYAAGVRVINTLELAEGTIKQAGYFDVSPDASGAVFLGAWSSFMTSTGILATTSISRGLFLLKPQMAFDTLGVFSEDTEPTPDNPNEEDDPFQLPGLSTAASITLVSGVSIILATLAVLVAIRRFHQRHESSRDSLPVATIVDG